jgi:chromosomal replication initiator protein
VPAEPESIWNEIRAELREQTPDFKFHIWLEPLELAAIEGRTLFVRAPEHIRTWVAERYLGQLRRAAASRFHPDAGVEIVDVDWRPAGSAAGEAPAAAAGAAEPALPGAPLNPKYTFEQFVIGPANRFAHASALAVAEMPAQAYNPLFLHGSPGLGKTHLLHAIGNYVTRYGSGLRVRYATVEDFTSAFVDAVRFDRTAAFKEAFRRVDVVLIDDVQFLARKERTREEFFHTFNALRDSGRQLVMTSDRSPEELADLEPRLIERFRSGLVVELEPPGIEVRRAILHKRARLDGVALEPEVLEEIAARVTSSVRALEGALIRVVAYASLKGEPPTPELVRRVLQRLGITLGLSQIVDATAREFGVQAQELLARNRRPEVARARQVAMYLAHELSHESSAEIGRELHRDHSTVLHAIKRVQADLPTDRHLQTAVDNVRQRLGRSA